MKLRLSSCVLSVVVLATACSSDDKAGGKKAAASSCDEDKIGEDCTCDDDAEGKYECNDDDLECVCDVASDDEAPPAKRDAGKKDASAPKDAGKTPPKDTGVSEDVDSGDPEPEPEPDAGDPGPGTETGDKPKTLPTVKGACPDLKDGTITVGGAKVRIWVGSKPGPVYLYFHGTGTQPGEIDQGIPGASSSVKSAGGIAASWDTSNNMGSNTGTIWYTGDMDAADQLIACGIEKNLVDTARIHVSGYSAGGLETGAFVVGRSNYVASVIVYSGGKPFGVSGKIGGGGFVPSMVGAHGAAGSDSLILDFGTQTPALGKEIAGAGGFAIDCDDGGSHVQISRLGLGGKALDFFKAHPWGQRPWKAVPAGWPSSCKLLSK